MAVFADAFEDPESYLGHEPTDAYLTAQLAKPHVIAIVGLFDDTVAGGLVAYQLDKLEQERREIYIYDLAVDERWRRRGVATGVIAALQREAARRDAYVIYVQADLDDAPAIALYETLGVGEVARHFDIEPAKKAGAT
jgi:aminoglycoside 3-N-acetyltransferase I